MVVNIAAASTTHRHHPAIAAAAAAHHYLPTAIPCRSAGEGGGSASAAGGYQLRLSAAPPAGIRPTWNTPRGCPAAAVQTSDPSDAHRRSVGMMTQGGSQISAHRM